MSDVRSITPEDIEKLKLLLRTSAWNDVMKPALLGRKLQLLDMLMKEPEQRDGAMSDAAIRGGLKQLDWMMSRFDQVVQEYDANLLNDERLKQTQAP